MDISTKTIAELEALGYLTIVISPEDIPKNDSFDIQDVTDAMLRAYDFYNENLPESGD